MDLRLRKPANANPNKKSQKQQPDVMRWKHTEQAEVEHKRRWYKQLLQHSQRIYQHFNQLHLAGNETA